MHEHRTLCLATQGGVGKVWNIPVTHMPEKLYMSSAIMSIRRTMAIGLEWKIICMTVAQLLVTLCIAT